MPPVNPWLSLTSSNPFVTTCDLSAINRLSQADRKNVFLDLHPEPFCGDPDAEVYLLNGNPGYSDQDNCFACPSTPMTSMMSDVYSHKNRDFIWIDSTNPFQTSCPRTGRTILHQGHVYWQKRLKELIDTVQQMKGRAPRLFELEYYPYHSETFFPFMATPLPSFDYTRFWVLDAISKGKIIFILRHQREWMSPSAIPELKDYPKLFTLKSTRSTYLTSGNMSASAWAELVARC